MEDNYFFAVSVVVCKCLKLLLVSNVSTVKVHTLPVSGIHPIDLIETVEKCGKSKIKISIILLDIILNSKNVLLFVG